MNKTLYLMEMGMNDNNITTDIKNHRVRVLENIDIMYKGNKYNMFFEFTQCTHREYRTTNKRTGQPLKHPKVETILTDALGLDTQFEKLETRRDGSTWESSWRKCDLEEEVWKECHKYTRADVLEVVNRYKIGVKYNRVVLVEEEARRIIRTLGGWREKDILGEGKDFHTEGSSYMQRGETWTDEHKIIRINKQTWTQEGNGRRLVVTDFCEVDIVTGKITA